MDLLRRTRESLAKAPLFSVPKRRGIVPEPDRSKVPRRSPNQDRKCELEMLTKDHAWLCSTGDYAFAKRPGRLSQLKRH